MVASNFSMKANSSGLYWKGVTERTSLSSVASFPLVHRRIVFRSPASYEGARIVQRDSSVVRRPLLPFGSQDDVVTKMLFGGKATWSNLTDCRLEAAGLEVLEDSRRDFNPTSVGFVKHPKFYNSLSSRVVYEGKTDFASRSSGTQNIYLWEAYNWGIPDSAFIGFTGDMARFGLKAEDADGMDYEQSRKPNFPAPSGYPVDTKTPLMVSGELLLYYKSVDP